MRCLHRLNNKQCRHEENHEDSHMLYDTERQAEIRWSSEMSDKMPKEAEKENED